MAALPENTLSASPTPAATASKSMIDVILDTLEDAKAEETVAVDITGKSSLADHMVVTSGRHLAHRKHHFVRRLRAHAAAPFQAAGIVHELRVELAGDHQHGVGLRGPARGPEPDRTGCALPLRPWAG